MTRLQYVLPKVNHCLRSFNGLRHRMVDFLGGGGGVAAVRAAKSQPLPLPGAVGVTEGGFALLFAALIPAELMGVAIILSRFISFALPLVASGIGTLLLGGMPECDG